MARALKFSITTSATAASSRNVWRPAGAFKSNATLPLLRCNLTNTALAFHGSAGCAPPSQPPMGKPPR